jgi:hypothetical protein
VPNGLAAGRALHVNGRTVRGGGGWRWHAGVAIHLPQRHQSAIRTERATHEIFFARWFHAGFKGVPTPIR